MYENHFNLLYLNSMYRIYPKQSKKITLDAKSKTNNLTYVRVVNCLNNV